MLTPEFCCVASRIGEGRAYDSQPESEQPSALFSDLDDSGWEQAVILLETHDFRTIFAVSCPIVRKPRYLGECLGRC